MKISSLHRKLRLALIAVASVALAGMPVRLSVARGIHFQVPEATEPGDASDDDPLDNEVTCDDPGTDDFTDDDTADEGTDEDVSDDDASGDDGDANGDDASDDSDWEDGNCGGDETDDGTDDPADDTTDDGDNVEVTFYSLSGHGKGARFSIERYGKVSEDKSSIALKGAAKGLKTVRWKVLGRDRHFRVGVVRSGKWTAPVKNLRHGKNRVVVFAVSASGAKTKRVTLVVVRK